MKKHKSLRSIPHPKALWLLKTLLLALVSGFGLMIWILVQMSMVPFSFLQPLLLSWGAALVLLCYNPGIQNYYAMPEDEMEA